VRPWSGWPASPAAISYSHMLELTVRHGESGWRAHAFPLSVDGIELAASMLVGMWC
jgi:hypothetical protein